MRSGIGNDPRDPLYVSQSASFTDTSGNTQLASSPNASTATARLLSAAASTNATSVKAGPGIVYLIDGYNSNAAARYLKLYNKASAPTVGTDTPILTRYLAPQASFSLSLPAGLSFSAGIAYALTTGAPDADTGALTAGDIVALNVAYR